MRLFIRVPLFAAAVALSVGAAQASPAGSSQVEFATIAAPNVLSSPAVAEMRAGVRDKKRIRVIVTLDRTFDAGADSEPAKRAADARALASAQDAVARRVHRGRRTLDPADRFDSVPAMLMTVDAAELERLLRDEAVETVQLDRPVKLTPRLAEMREITSIEKIWPANRGAKGEGEQVTIIDEGLDSDIPELKGQVVAEACVSNVRGCFNPRTQAFDANSTKGRFAAWSCRGKPGPTHKAGRYCQRYGHGGVVSIVAGGTDAAAGRFAGFGPKLDIRFVRMDLQGSSIGSFARAFDVAVAGDGGRRSSVVTTSIGITAKRSETLCEGVSPAMEKIFARADRLGIAVLNSAGNDGEGKIDYPGCHPLVIAVGASTEAGDKVAGFADVNDMVDMLSPGDAVKVGATADETMGSSFSTPSVASAIAQLRRAFPGKSQQDILTGLRCSGKRVKPSDAERRFVSVPRLDAAAAYRFLAEPKPPASVFNFDNRKELRTWAVGAGHFSVSEGSLRRDLRQLTFATTSAIVDQCFDDFHVEAGMSADFESGGQQGAGLDETGAVVTGNFGLLVLTTTASPSPAAADVAPMDGYVFGFGRSSEKAAGFAYIYRLKRWTHDPAARPAGAALGASLCFLPETPVGLAGSQKLGVSKTGATLTMSLNGAKVCQTEITEADHTGALGVIRGVGFFDNKAGASVIRSITDVAYLRIEPR